MIFQLLKQLETDVWFCFDGFYYGCECVIEECTKESLSVVLKPQYRSKNSDLIPSLTKLFKKKRPKMRAELRIYFPSKFAKEINSGRRILLCTESAPTLYKHQLHDLKMKFINLNGLNAKHAQNWKNVISYEFTSGFDNF